MSFAWTTLGALALLLPGIAFFGGLYSSDRFPREFGRNNPFMDVGLSIFAAAVIHFAVLLVALVAASQSDTLSPPDAAHWALETLRAPNGNHERLLWFVVAGMSYIVATPVVAFVVGRTAATAVFSRLSLNMARHQWIRELTATQHRASEYNKAYVVTTLGDDHHAVMYEGFLKEFYFTKEGRIAYLVLTNTARFQLRTGEAGVSIDERRDRAPIPGVRQRRSAGSGRYPPLLVIEGSSIHNVVFESVGDLDVQPDDTEALNAAVSRHGEASA